MQENSRQPFFGCLIPPSQKPTHYIEKDRWGQLAAVPASAAQDSVVYEATLWIDGDQTGTVVLE
jgi:hypothetical protein